MPTPIFVGNMTHALRIIKLPDAFIELDEDEKLKYVKKIIQKHFAENNGGIVAFGHIKHYCLREKYDYKIDDIQIFTTDGDVMTNPPDDIERLHGTPGGLYLKGGTRIDHLFN